MLYIDLSPEEKKILGAADKMLRAYSGEANSLMETGRRIDDYVNAAGVSAILASLNASEVVPNSTDLAGSVDLTKEEYEGTIADNSLALTTFATDEKRQKQIRAAGINAS